MLGVTDHEIQYPLFRRPFGIDYGMHNEERHQQGLQHYEIKTAHSSGVTPIQRSKWDLCLCQCNHIRAVRCVEMQACLCMCFLNINCAALICKGRGEFSGSEQGSARNN